MNDLTRNKKTPEANLKDCVLSLAEIVESLVGIQQQTARAERIKECADNESVKQNRKVAPVKTSSERQSVVRHGGQMFRASTPASNVNSLYSHVTPSSFTQKRPRQMNRLDRAGQLSKENLVAKRCVRLHDKPSGHTQKKPSRPRVSSRPLEECLDSLTNGATVTNQACVCSPSRQKKTEQSAKPRIALREKFNPSAYLDHNCSKRTIRSEKEDIEGESFDPWQYVNEPNELPSSSNQKAVKNLGSGINSMQDACILWKMMDRLRCIEEDLEDLTLPRPSHQGGTLTTKRKAHYDKNTKSYTDESKNSAMPLEKNGETIRNDCIDDLKEIFAGLEIEVPDELWTDPRKARFFLDIILDLLEDEDIQKTDPIEAKGGSASKELDCRKELFIKELEKSLEIKTPEPTSVVKLLELIYLQRGKEGIGRIKTQNIFRDDTGRISQNCGVVSSKVDPFQLLALNSGTHSKNNTASKAKNVQKGFKDESDADTGHSEGETYGLMDQSFKGQYTPTRIAKPNLKTERIRSAEPRWCYCQENNKTENAEDPRWSSTENIQKEKDSAAKLSQNVFIKPDPDAQELPHDQTEGLLGQEQISADTKDSRKILSPDGQDSQNIEITQENGTLRTTEYARTSDPLDQVRMDTNKPEDLTDVTSLRPETPTHGIEAEIIPQKLNNHSEELSEPTPPGLPDVVSVGRNVDFYSRLDNIERAPRIQTPSRLSSIDQNNIENIASRLNFDTKELSEEIDTSPGRPDNVAEESSPINRNSIEKLEDKSTLTGITNAEDANTKGPLAQFPQQYTTPTGRPNMPTIARKIDFNAENSLISDFENKLESQPAPESPDLEAFSNFGEGAPTSNAKAQVTSKENHLSTNDQQTTENDSTPVETKSVHIIGSGFSVDQEVLPQQIGSTLQNPTEKHTKSKLNFLTSCISSPDREDSTSIAPQEDQSIRNLHKEELTSTATQEFQSIHKLNTSYMTSFAPNETSYLNAQDSPSYSDLTDDPLNHHTSTYSTPHDITPELEDQTTAENGVEPLSDTTNLKLPNSSSLEGPLASSTLKEIAEIETPRIDTDTLEIVNRTTYNLTNIASPPLSPDRFSEPLAFGAPFSPNPNPQLDSSQAEPTDFPADQFSPIISTPPRFARDDSAALAAGTNKRRESKGDSPKLPEGYEALDDMIEVTLRGFEKMSNFLQKEPRITAIPNLPDDPNELNKVFAAKITEMENTLSAVINCIQCTLVEMSRVIERRAGITIPEAHLHDDLKIINLHCSKIFETCKKDIGESNEGKNDLETD